MCQAIWVIVNWTIRMSFEITIQENAFKHVIRLVRALVYLFIVVLWHHTVTKIWVNIGSDNGLFPDSTKPLTEPMMTYHQRGLVAFT